MSEKAMRSKLAMQGLLLFDPSSKADQRKLQQAALASDSAGKGVKPDQADSTEPEVWSSKAAKRKAQKERKRLREAAAKLENLPQTGGGTKPEDPEGKPTPEPPQQEAAGLAESAVPRVLNSDYTKRFNKVQKRPNPSHKEKRTPQEHADSLLPKTSADVKKQQETTKEIEGLRNAITPTMESFVKDCIEAKVEELENQLKANTSPKIESNPARQRAELQKAVAEVDRILSERKAAYPRHDEEAATDLREMKAQLEEERARLNQLEEQYLSLAKQKAEAWATKNKSMDDHLEETKAVLNKQLGMLAAIPGAGMDLEDGSDGLETLPELPTTGHSTAAVVAAATAGDQAAAVLLAQSDLTVEFTTDELRDINTVKPGEEELVQLAHLWEMIQTSLLEDPRAVITFGQCGLHANVWGGLIGDKLWYRLFAAPKGIANAADAIPYQLRQLASFQMRGLNDILMNERSTPNSGKQGRQRSRRTLQRSGRSNRRRRNLGLSPSSSKTKQHRLHHQLRAQLQGQKRANKSR